MAISDILDRIYVLHKGLCRLRRKRNDSRSAQTDASAAAAPVDFDCWSPWWRVYGEDAETVTELKPVALSHRGLAATGGRRGHGAVAAARVRDQGTIIG